MRSLGVRPICESPDVKLSLIAHQLQAKEVVHCISFATAGLQALGQQEIIFTLRVTEEIAEVATEADIPTPESLMQLLQMVVQYAVNGQFVRAGDRTILDLDKGAGLFGRHDFRAVLYINGSEDFPRDCLHALLLTRGEAVWLERLGPVRVMAKLGEANRFFPSTIWIDMDRPSVFDADDLEKSAVVQMGLRLRSVGTPRGAWVYLQICDNDKPWETTDAGGPVVGANGPDHSVGGEGSKKRCLLEYGEDFRTFMTDPEKECLSGDDAQVGFFTSPEQDALHIMTYQVGKAPNDTRLTAISSPLRKQNEDVVTVLGNYVFMVQCGDKACGANLLEDGFVVMVPSMPDLIAAVKAGKPFDIPPQDESMLPFRLQPKRGAFDAAALDPSQLALGATLKEVRLLSPDEQIAAAIGDAGELAKCVSAAAKQAEDFFTAAARDAEVPLSVKKLLNVALVSATLHVTEEGTEVSLGVQVRRQEGEEEEEEEEESEAAGEKEGEEEEKDADEKDAVEKDAVEKDAAEKDADEEDADEEEADDSVEGRVRRLLRAFSESLGDLAKAEKGTTFDMQLGFVLKLCEGEEAEAAATAEASAGEEGVDTKKEEEKEEDAAEGADAKKAGEDVGDEAAAAAEEAQTKKSVDAEEEEGIDKEKADVGRETTADADVATQG